MCAHVQCVWVCTSHLYQSLLDRNGVRTSGGAGKRGRGCVMEAGGVGGSSERDDMQGRCGGGCSRELCGEELWWGTVANIVGAVWTGAVRGKLWGKLWGGGGGGSGAQLYGELCMGKLCVEAVHVWEGLWPSCVGGATCVGDLCAWVSCVGGSWGRGGCACGGELCGQVCGGGAQVYEELCMGELCVGAVHVWEGCGLAVRRSCVHAWGAVCEGAVLWSLALWGNLCIGAVWGAVWGTVWENLCMGAVWGAVWGTVWGNLCMGAVWGSCVEELVHGSYVGELCGGSCGLCFIISCVSDPIMEFN